MALLTEPSPQPCMVLVLALVYVSAVKGEVPESAKQPCPSITIYIETGSIIGLELTK